MDPIIFAQLNEAYHKGVYVQEETLSEEEYLDIQEWVEALIEEGYDLDQYTDEELYEAYLAEANKGDDLFKQLYSGKKVKGLKTHQPGQNRFLAQQNAKRSAERYAKDMGRNRTPSYSDYEGSSWGSQKENLDLYDLVSEYLVSEGFCDSYEDADVIMANMSEEWREGIVEEVLDEAVKGSQRSLGNIITGNDIRQVRRGGSTIYKKPKWQDRVETGVSRDMGKEGHKNPYQYGTGATKQAKASIERMNAAKNVEVNHDYDGNDDVETVSTNSLSGYRTVPTNYRARRRRASGR